MDVALASSVWVTSPEFAGSLVKRGFHWRKLWKIRWVALHGAEIAYMDAEPNAETTNMAITKAQITSATVIDREDVDAHPHGFAIHVNDGHSPPWYLRADSTREKKSWLMRLDHVHAIVRWLEDFEKVRVLGVGGAGIVYEILHKTNGSRFALKEMEIKNQAQMSMALAEAAMLKEIMENISHPSILHIEKVFQVGSKFYLVFPLCAGGELYEHVIRRGHFNEQDAAVILKDLVSGLFALHKNDILHLDIKPENILFDSKDDDARIKITDFGLSKVFDKGGTTDGQDIGKDELAAKLKAFSENGVLQRDKLRGTVGYMSPELILTGMCCKGTDIWAAGVVLYILLCGHPPFQSKSNREILERSARGVVVLEGDEWSDVSDDAKDLVKKMLTVDLQKRITAMEILNHPWVSLSAKSLDGSSTSTPSKGVESKGSNNLTEALRKLSGFVSSRKTEKLASSFTRLVSSLNSDKPHRTNLLSQLLYPEKYLTTSNNVNAHPTTSPERTTYSKKPFQGSGSSAPSSPGVLGTVFTSSEMSQDDLPSMPTLTHVSEHPDPVDEEEEDCLSEDTLSALLNPDTRDAMASAFNTIGACDGKLSLPQFMAVLRHYQSQGMSSTGEGSGDVEAVSSQSGGSHGPLGIGPLLLCRFVDRDGDGMISADDIFTTHALITQKSAVWTKAIFRVYVESLWYPGRQINYLRLYRSCNSIADPLDKKTFNVLEEQQSLDTFESPKFITERNVKAAFEKMGYDPIAGAKIFNVLCEALHRRGSFGLGAMSNGTTNTTTVHTPPRKAAFTSEEDELDSINKMASDVSLNDMPSADANTAASGSSISSPTTSTADNSKYRMDIHDFVRASELDDVLVKIFFVKPKKRLSSMIRKAEKDYVESLREMESGGVCEDEENKGSAGRVRLSSSTLFTDELISVLSPPSSKHDDFNFPIATGIGRFVNNLVGASTNGDESD